MTSNHTDVTTMLGRDVYDRDGDKIGSVGQVYADHAGQPTWASVNTGFFGLRQSLVPLSGATSHGDGLQVPFEKATVKDAPNVDHEVDEPLTSDQVQELYRHYQLQWDTDSTADYADGYTAGAEHTRDGYLDTDGDAMPRSEKHTDTARLRRYGSATSGADVTESEHEMQLDPEVPGDEGRRPLA
ncbi:PRC-barrel domain-containing protein [Dactylosporangium sp. McL0621]|uniref:PRC-barrel domain-containing protein n=1 Tax=Dactylosporangium sp. McL0621 TaxID=3415678 RepID=UPI003CE9BA46